MITMRAVRSSSSSWSVIMVLLLSAQQLLHDHKCGERACVVQGAGMRECGEREYRRAIELSPGYATAHSWYGAWSPVHAVPNTVNQILRSARVVDRVDIQTAAVLNAGDVSARLNHEPASASTATWSRMNRPSRAAVSAP